jgi:hypothetical protein
MPSDGTCRLCGRTGQKLTKEHALPDWLSEWFTTRLQEAKIDHIVEVGGVHRHWRTPRLSLVVAGICQKCNNVRLSRFEDKMKPVLLPLFDAQPLTTQKHLRIRTHVQADLSRWVYKTALMLDRTGTQNAPSTALRRFHDEWLPARGTTIHLGLGDPSKQLAEYHFASLAGYDEAGHIVHSNVGWTVTFRIGYLVMQVVSPTFVKEGLMLAPSWDAFLVPIWPSSRVYRFWPPERGLGPAHIEALNAGRPVPDEGDDSAP